MKAMIIIFASFAICLLGLIAFSLTNSFGLMSIIIAGLFLVFFWSGFKKIQANPPHKGMLTILGKRQDQILNEGIHFFPFYPFWFGFIPIMVEQINESFTIENAMTPDRAPIQIKIALGFTPDDLIKFANSGQKAGVIKVLKFIMESRVRSWAFSSGEGPQNWMEAKAAKEDAEAILLKAILGESLTPIPLKAQKFPTTIWIKYFNEIRPALTDKDKELAGVNYEKVDGLFLRSGLTDEEKTEIKEAAEDRRKAIEDARQGNGSCIHKPTGVAINRLNIEEIKTSDKLEQAAESQAREEQERKGETREVEADTEKAKVLLDFLRANGCPEISAKEVFDIIMTWKATRGAKNAYSFTIPGLSPALLEAAKKILG
jgi:regulator of protease activity HflC (stomatin/prohibitin superfamily)